MTFCCKTTNWNSSYEHSQTAIRPWQKAHQEKLDAKPNVQRYHQQKSGAASHILKDSLVPSRFISTKNWLYILQGWLTGSYRKPIKNRSYGYQSCCRKCQSQCSFPRRICEGQVGPSRMVCKFCRFEQPVDPGNSRSQRLLPILRSLDFGISNGRHRYFHFRDLASLGTMGWIMFTIGF